MSLQTKQTPTEAKIIAPPKQDLAPAYYPVKDGLEFRVNASLSRLIGNPASNPQTAVSLGERHSVIVPRKATKRYLWLAFNAIRSETVAAWYMTGRLVFYLNGQRVSELPLSAGNAQALTGGINFFGPSPSGGPGGQPNIKVTAYDDFLGAARVLDLACYEFNVECDRITLEVDTAVLGAAATVKVSDIRMVSVGDYTWTNANIYQSAALKIGASANTIGPCSQIWNFDTFNATYPTKLLGVNVQPALKFVNFMSDWNAIDAATYLSSAPAVTIAGTNAGGSTAPTFAYTVDGIAQLLTGFVVMSQYPGGL